MPFRANAKPFTADIDASRVSYLYSEPSLVALPTVPRLFSEQDEQDDGHSQSSIESFYRKTPGAFHALCSLSDLGCQIMTYNYNIFPTNGGPTDYLKRDEFYATLTGWYSSLPKRLHAEENFTAQTCHLQWVIHTLTLPLSQDIQHD